MVSEPSWGNNEKRPPPGAYCPPMSLVELSSHHTYSGDLFPHSSGPSSSCPFSRRPLFGRPFFSTFRSFFFQPLSLLRPPLRLLTPPSALPSTDLHDGGHDVVNSPATLLPNSTCASPFSGTSRCLCRQASTSGNIPSSHIYPCHLEPFRPRLMWSLFCNPFVFPAFFCCRYCFFSFPAPSWLLRVLVRILVSGLPSPPTCHWFSGKEFLLSILSLSLFSVFSGKHLQLTAHFLAKTFRLPLYHCTFPHVSWWLLCFAGCAFLPLFALFQVWIILGFHCSSEVSKSWF